MRLKPSKGIVSTRRLGRGLYRLTYSYKGDVTQRKVRFPKELDRIITMFRTYLRAKGVKESTATRYIQVVRALLVHYLKYPTWEEVEEFALRYTVRGGASVMEAARMFHEYLDKTGQKDEVQMGVKEIVLDPWW